MKHKLASSTSDSRCQHISALKEKAATRTFPRTACLADKAQCF